ncbi:MAG: hypothetical protein ACK5LZ_06060 [Anaerorhabdus sp.]
MEIFNSDVLRRHERLLHGLAAGIFTAIICGVTVAFILFYFSANFSIFYYIGVGLLVGIAMQKFGRGVTTSFSIAAVFCAILSFFIIEITLIFLSVPSIFDFYSLFEIFGLAFKYILTNIFGSIYYALYWIAGAVAAFRHSRII